MTPGKTIALTRCTCVGKVMSLLFNVLSRLVITFLLRSKCLPISTIFIFLFLTYFPLYESLGPSISLHYFIPTSSLGFPGDSVIKNPLPMQEIQETWV